jgi:Rv0078B-related antitoxin
MDELNTKPPVVEVLDADVVRILRAKTASERLVQAFRIWESARAIVAGGVRRQYPDWDEDQIRRETANRLSQGATERVPR